MKTCQYEFTASPGELALFLFFFEFCFLRRKIVVLFFFFPVNSELLKVLKELCQESLPEVQEDLVTLLVHLINKVNF